MSLVGLWEYCRTWEWAARPRSMFYLVGVAGGHSGREKQEGRVQGWLQAGVQQAAASTREQVGGCLPSCPQLDTGIGHQPGWEGFGCWEPLTDAGYVSALRP